MDTYCKNCQENTETVFGDKDRRNICIKCWHTKDVESIARLIRAAPAMLEALKGIIDIGFVPEGPRWKRVLQACKAAIAQAKGE